MNKHRSVSTHFWSDNYVIDLDPTEKLLFLYLLTNERTNMLGIYEIHIRRIAFDTGIDKEMVKKILDRFEEDGKASYIDGYVVLHNFTKHQAYNTNMKKSALNAFKELPNSLKTRGLCEPLLKPLEPFPEGYEPIAEIERENEREMEKESVSENNADPRSHLAKSAEYGDEAYKLSQYLLDSIVNWDPDHKYASNPPSLKSWVKDIERAMRLDGRTYKQLKFIIAYIYKANGEHSAFWAGNIESGKKLRKHFDKIKNQIKRDKNYVKHQRKQQAKQYVDTLYE